MNNNRSFWSLSDMKQPVNQWIGLAFIGVWVFWFLMFYVTAKTKEIGETFNNFAVLPVEVHHAVTNPPQRLVD